MRAVAQQLFGLERIGEDDGGLQFEIVELLSRAGWQPAFVGPTFGRDPAGSTVLTAKKYGRDLRVVAPTRREAVSELLQQISRIERLPVLRPEDVGAGESHEQLELADETETWEEWWATLDPHGQTR